MRDIKGLRGAHERTLFEKGEEFVWGAQDGLEYSPDGRHLGYG